jgi:hypothetical protein
MAAKTDIPASDRSFNLVIWPRASHFTGFFEITLEKVSYFGFAGGVNNVSI